MCRLYLKLAKKAIASTLIVTAFFFPLTVAAKTPNDPAYEYQSLVWDKIGAPQAWNYTTGSKDSVVAVIDTGADTWHDDLADNIWINKREIPDNNVDDDKNGYVDDVNGWNFVENNNDVRTSVFDSNDDAEAVRHGTVIAGLIGAVGNNSMYGTGVNWSVKIMPLRGIASDGTGSYNNLRKAIQYAVDNGAHVITMSFTGDSNSSQLKKIIYDAYKRGVVVVAAAGNHDGKTIGDLDVKPNYPACFDRGETENWVLTVGSTRLDDTISTFSDYGSCVDIMAPGEEIFSTERYAPQYGYETAFGGEWRGTSFAAPIVAGAAALLKSFRPDWEAQQIIPTLLATVDPIEHVNSGYEGKIGKGRLNIAKAIKVASDAIVYQPSGSFYAATGGTIHRLNIANAQVAEFISLKNATIVSLSATQDDSDVSILYRVGNVYYVRLLKGDGTFVREFALPTKHSAVMSAKRIRLTNDLSSIVEQYDTRRKITTFTVYDYAGEHVSQFEVAGSVAGWDTTKELKAMVYAQVEKNGLMLRRVNFETEDRTSFTMKGLTNIDDLRVARFDEFGPEQVAIVTRSGRETIRYTISIDGQYYRKDVADALDIKSAWYLRPVFYSSSPVYHWLLHTQTGTFSILTRDDQLLSTVTIPDGFGKLLN